MARLGLLWLALAACEHGSTPPPPDVFDPPPPPPPPEGEVRVHVVKDGAPVEGVKVFFQDSFERPVASIVTDASGDARAIVQQGATVTAVNPFGPKDGADDVRTWLGVGVGDTLNLSEDTRAIAVTFTAPLDASITRYELHTTCGSGPLAKQNGLARGQLTLVACNGSADALVIGFDGTDVARFSMQAHDLAVADGTTIDLTANYEAISTTPITWSGANGTTLAATTAVHSARGEIFDLGYQVAVNAQVGNRDVPVPNFVDATVVTETRPQPNDFAVGQQQILDWGPAGSGQFVGLFQGEVLPDLLSLPTMSGARDVFWSEASFVAQMLESAPPPQENRADVDLVTVKATRGERSWQWALAVPHIGGVARYPVLPLDANEFNLGFDDAIEIVGFWQAKVPGGYDTVRGRIHDVRRPQDLMAIPFSGRLLVQTPRE